MLTKLENLCEIKSSKRIFESEYVSSGIPFIRGQEVSDGTIFDNNSYACYINENRYNELKLNYGVPQKGDILITAVGTIGNLCYIDRNFKFYYKDGNLLQFTNFIKDIDSKYLFYFMHSNYFKKQLNNNLIGAVQKALTIAMLNKINVPLIDLYSQQKIVDILSLIDAQIKRNNTVVKKLQVLVHAIYTRYFLQFDFLNEEGKPYKSSGGKMVWNEKLKREVPEGWKTKSLKECCKIVLGGTPKTDENKYWNGDINWLNSGEIANFPIINSELKITTLGMNNSATTLMKKGTTVVSITGNLHASVLAIDSCANQSVVGVLENSKFKSAYIYPFIKNMIVTFSKISTGNCQQHINKGTIENTILLIPSEKVLKEYYEKVSNFYEFIFKNSLENQKITSLRNVLLPLLLNGQLK